jgi:DNA-binding transcriptional LysR family regulator
MDAISFDQIQVFLAVAEQGSFSAAARSLNRTQSAVTYAVQKLEGQVGFALFDRAAYRPALTEAALALLPRARRVAEEMAALRTQARSIAEGVEAELALVVDALFPMARVLEALRAFSLRYPAVSTRLYVESLGASTALVLDGSCALGLLATGFSDSDRLTRVPLLDIAMVPVAAPSHPLAALHGLVPAEAAREHVQLVLTDKAAGANGRDHGVLSTRTWRLGDLGAKHAMLLAGLGWGNMPAHMVEQDIMQGRLRRIQLAELAGAGGQVMLPMCAGYRTADPPGPAGRWMIEHLTTTAMATIEGRSR